jgi:hypothetical protein
MTEKQAAELIKQLTRIANALEKQTTFITSPRYIVDATGPELVTDLPHWYSSSNGEETQR